MRRLFIASISAVAAIVAITSLTSVSVSAQSQSKPANGNPNALRISPVRSDINVKPGETKTIEVSVTNVTNSISELKGIINDFGPSDDESGDPQLYLDNGSAAPSHGLKDYIKPIGNITLQPQERLTIKVTISIPTKAAGGGYYGAVRFAPASSGPSKSVSLSGSVGSLILVTVPGDIVEKASIKSFNVARQDDKNAIGKASSLYINGAKDANGKGLQAVLRVENTGNIQLAPFGKAILKRGGKEVATYELNRATPPANVLPESTRRFQIDLGDKTSSFGKYTLEGNFGYGTSGQLISAKTSFYIVPLPHLIIGIVLLLVIVGAVVIAPRMMKSHDRKLIRKIRGSGRK